MSLKITDANGFKIGGVLNPAITTIYVRVLANMWEGKQKPVYDGEGNLTQVKIYCQAKVTLNGGLFDEAIQVDYIFNNYWLNYDAGVTDMNLLYAEIEQDLKAKLIVDNPEWDGKISIVTLGSNPAE